MGNFQPSFLTQISPLVGAPLLGLVVGLALNRLISCWSAGRPLLRGLGRCQVCDGQLPWGAWLPGLELIVPGAMPACGHPLPRWRLPGVLFLVLASAGMAFSQRGEPWTAQAPSFLLLYLLYPLAAIDLLRLEVETRLVVLGIVLRFAQLALPRDPRLVEMIGGMLMGAGLFAMVEVVYRTLRGRPGLGDGDAAVMGLIGAFVGWQGVLPVVALGAVSGLLVGLPALLLARRSLMTPIPFVPFLALAGMTVFLAQNVWPELWARLIMAIGSGF